MVHFIAPSDIVQLMAAGSRGVDGIFSGKTNDLSPGARPPNEFLVARSFRPENRRRCELPAETFDPPDRFKLEFRSIDWKPRRELSRRFWERL